MGWLNKQNDPVSERARELSAEIAALEAEIQRLDQQLHRSQNQPRLRSTAVPHGATIRHGGAGLDEAAQSLVARTDPVFEHIGQERIQADHDLPNAPEHFNEFGVRKIHLPALIQRWRMFFSGPNTSNPRLVSYLAAGGVHGLRPLRRERRVARNRFILFSILLFVVLFGTFFWFLRNR